VPQAEVDAEAGRAHYTSWKQVAGYFDGDGNVGLEVVKRVLRFKLRFVDTWRPQVESIAKFLAKSGIRCGDLGKGEKRGNWQAAYRLDVIEVKSVLAAAKAMVNNCVKKRLELETLVDYLEGRITGNRAIAVFNESVRSGRRRGRIRVEDIPYTRDEGLRVVQLENARRARAAYAVNVSLGIQEQIRKDHVERKLGFIRPGMKYGYSVSVIRRILGVR
jgi:hypothetical protein